MNYLLRSKETGEIVWIFELHQVRFGAGEVIFRGGPKPKPSEIYSLIGSDQTEGVDLTFGLSCGHEWIGFLQSTPRHAVSNKPLHQSSC